METEVSTEDKAAVSPNNGRSENSDWLKSHTKSFALRWATVSGVLWLTAWNKGGLFISGAPLIIAAVTTSCAAIGFYIAHRVKNK